MDDTPEDLEAVLGAATRRLLELVATSRQVGPHESPAVVAEAIAALSPADTDATLFAAVTILDTLGVGRA